MSEWQTLLIYADSIIVLVSQKTSETGKKIGNTTVGRQFWCICFTLQKELIEAYKLGSEVPLCIGHGSKVMFNYSFPIYKLKIV